MLCFIIKMINIPCSSPISFTLGGKLACLHRPTKAHSCYTRLFNFGINRQAVIHHHFSEAIFSKLCLFQASTQRSQWPDDGHDPRPDAADPRQRHPPLQSFEPPEAAVAACD